MSDLSSFQIPLILDIFLKLLRNFAEGFTRMELLQQALTEFQERWTSSGCDAALEKARLELKKTFAEKQSQWSKQAIRQWKPEWDGCQVAMNTSGVMSVYWQMPICKFELSMPKSSTTLT